MALATEFTILRVAVTTRAESQQGAVAFEFEFTIPRVSVTMAAGTE